MAQRFCQPILVPWLSLGPALEPSHIGLRGLTRFIAQRMGLSSAHHSLSLLGTRRDYSHDCPSLKPSASQLFSSHSPPLHLFFPISIIPRLVRTLRPSGTEVEIEWPVGCSPHSKSYTSRLHTLSNACTIASKPPSSPSPPPALFAISGYLCDDCEDAAS